MKRTKTSFTSMQTVSAATDTLSAPSRRTLLKAGALGAGALALGTNAVAQVFSPGVKQGRERGITPYALVDRTSFGLSLKEMNLYDQLGWNGYLERQLNPRSIDDSKCLARLNQFETVNYTPYQVLKWTSDGVNADWECIQSTIIRSLYTDRQLLEVMTEFWMNHFSVYVYNVSRELLPEFIRTIRNNALGKFSTLLSVVTKSPAMLQYLDNLNNTKGNMNQNFAREFMELHSLGVNGGYSEADVRLLAKIFTGWGMEGYYEWPWDKTTNPNWGRFKFYAEYHDDEGGYFLGNNPANLIPKGGVVQGDTVIQRVATSTACAKFISTKLLRKFVTYNPSQALIDATAQVFLSSSGNITSVLRYILDENRFRQNQTTKLKRPFHLVCSGIRALEGEVTDADSLTWELFYNMKQIPLWWAPPNGYPDALDAWVDNLRPRWYFGFQLPLNWLWNTRVDIFSKFKSKDRDAVVDAINGLLFGGGLPRFRREELKAFMPQKPTNDQIKDAFGLALASPEFQVY